MNNLIRTLSIVLAIASTTQAEVIWQEAESLSDTGGWSNDSQHVDQMGSPYLLATGVGTPVDDASGIVTVATPGEYTLWVRCRDWFPSDAPGRFQVLVGDKASAVTFGDAKTDDWQWINGGTFQLKAGDVELRLKDSTGWWGRCDAIVLTTGDFQPASDLQPLNEQRIKHNGVSAEIKDKGTFDVVVVGGGSAGMGAALGAARNGAKVAFIQDRPVLGGNGSDEIMVPPMGNIGRTVDKINVTGVAEELFPIQGWSSFGSSKHYEMIIANEKNISLFLNTRAIGVEMSSKANIKSVVCVDVKTGQRWRIEAPLFIDTTGHGWIGHYAGAEYRAGTEARSEFNEAMAPVEANSHTMGNSLYKVAIKTMEGDAPFETPAWAYQWKSKDEFTRVSGRSKSPTRPEAFDKATRGRGRPISKPAGGFTWYMETGGMSNTIADAEKIRDDLFRMHVGIWGYQKNYSPNAASNAKQKMVWLNFVPGVRESRRLMGDYIMTQKDFDDQIEHADRVAFTDWGIDDHHPHGFFTKGIDVMHVYHGRRVSIPYRSLYSKNIENLLIAGRCMSVSHIALGGVRVQRPMAATGQAAGTAAAIATREKCSPRDVYQEHIEELQQILLKDGCYLTGIKNSDPKDLALTSRTRDRAVIDGWNREIANQSRAVRWGLQPIELTLAKPSDVASVHLTLQTRQQRVAFVVECFTDDGWKQVADVVGRKAQRRYVTSFDPVKTTKVRLVMKQSNAPVAVCEIRIYAEQGWTTDLPVTKAEFTPAKQPPTQTRLEGIVLDESEAKLTGAWALGELRPIHGARYIHDGNAEKGFRTATFTAQVPKPGDYKIRLLYSTATNRASNVPVSVVINGKAQAFVVNQKKSDGTGYLLGTFSIDKQFEVHISNKATNGYVIVDGLQLK